MKRIRATAVVLERNRVLLMRREVNGQEYFVFPGGGVEEGESVEDAVVREVLEEASLQVEPQRLLYRIVDEKSEHLFFLCRYISGEPKLGEGNERADASDTNVYQPLWYEMEHLDTVLVFPLEARDWLCTDVKNGFLPEVRQFESLVSERRKG